MVDPLALAFVIGGLVLLFAGATLSTYGVAGVGVLLGGGAGYLFGPSAVALAGIGGPVATVAAVLAGAVLGVVLTRLLLSFAVAAISFVVGSYVGLIVVAPALVGGAWYAEVTAAVAVGIVAAALGAFLTRTALVFVTGFLGAALVSRSLTPADLGAARAGPSVDPLVFDAAAPLFLALFALGVLSQVGLFKLGWVRNVLGILPTPGTSRNRGKGGEPAER